MSSILRWDVCTTIILSGPSDSNLLKIQNGSASRSLTPVSSFSPIDSRWNMNIRYLKNLFHCLISVSVVTIKGPYTVKSYYLFREFTFYIFFRLLESTPIISIASPI